MTAPNETFCLSSLAALREVGNLVTKGTMTKAQAEVVLQSFVTQGWLLKSRHGCSVTVLHLRLTTSSQTWEIFLVTTFHPRTGTIPEVHI